MTTIIIIIKFILIYKWIKTAAKSSIKHWILNLKKETHMYVLSWLITSILGCLVINYFVNIIFKILGGM